MSFFGVFTTIVLIISYIFCQITIGSSNQDITDDNLFVRCDQNRDYFISKSEWEKCIEDTLPASLSIFKSDGDEIFQLVDKNNDHSISLREYNDLQRNLLKRVHSATGKKGSDEYGDDEDELNSTDSEYITVRLKDGTYQKMKRSDLLHEMEQRGQGFRKTKGDNLVKEEVYSDMKLDIEHLEKENPALLKMIRLGNSSFEILKRMNHTDGKLVRITTLKDPDVLPTASQRLQMTEEEENDALINYHKEKVLSGKGMMFFLELSVEKSDKEIEFFEVHLEYNKTKYIPPHIAMTRAIRKSADKKSGVALKIPPLPIKQEKYTFTWKSLSRSVHSFATDVVQFRSLKPSHRANVLLVLFFCISFLAFLISFSFFLYFQLLPEQSIDDEKTDN